MEASIAFVTISSALLTFDVIQRYSVNKINWHNIIKTGTLKSDTFDAVSINNNHFSIGQGNYHISPICKLDLFRETSKEKILNDQLEYVSPKLLFDGKPLKLTPNCKKLYYSTYFYHYDNSMKYYMRSIKPGNVSIICNQNGKAEYIGRFNDILETYIYDTFGICNTRTLLFCTLVSCSINCLLGHLLGDVKKGYVIAAFNAGIYVMCGILPHICDFGLFLWRKINN